MKKPHLFDIESLTGIAITLVVIGHLATGNDLTTQGLEWYKFTKRLIYSFHMPLFMFLSGYIMYYSHPQIRNHNEYKNYIRKKLLRLLPSYILFVIIIFFAKLFFSNFLMVDNPVNNYSDFFDAFVKPTASYCGFIWYIYVLSEYFLIVPLLLILLRFNVLLIFFLSIGLYFIPVTNYFAMSYFIRFLVFFTLGMVMIEYNSTYIDIIEKYAVYFFSFFVVLLIVYYYKPLPQIVMGSISIFAMHAFVRRFLFNKGKVLSLIGTFSFSIYLMNLLVMGFVKGIGFKYFGATYTNFYALSVVMIFAGLFIPILIKKYLINRIAFLKSYIG